MKRQRIARTVASDAEPTTNAGASITTVATETTTAALVPNATDAKTIEAKAAKAEPEIGQVGDVCQVTFFKREYLGIDLGLPWGRLWGDWERTGTRFFVCTFRRQPTPTLISCDVELVTPQSGETKVSWCVSRTPKSRRWGFGGLDEQSRATAHSGVPGQRVAEEFDRWWRESDILKITLGQLDVSLPVVLPLPVVGIVLGYVGAIKADDTCHQPVRAGPNLYTRKHTDPTTMSEFDEIQRRWLNGES